MSVTQSPIKQLYNGDMIVNFKSKKEVQSINGYQDTTSMSTWYKQNPDKYNLGMIKLWGQQATASYPIYTQLLEKKAMLEVNGADGTFTYEVAIKDSKKCMTIKDYSNEFPNAGLDGSIFRIALSKRYAPGTILTTDMLFAEQIMVTDEEEIRQIPGGWDMPVKLSSQDRSASYDTSLLVKGLQYFKVSHNVLGEYGTNYENVDLIDTPTTMKMQFQLGNMSGAETYVTGRADMQSFSGASNTTTQYLDALKAEVDNRGEFAFMTDVTNIDAKGNVINNKNLRIGATMQLLLHREHQKSVNTQLLFQKAATIPGTNGVTRLNEGIWHQIRRGKLIQYGRPMGITRQHIKEAVEYVFRNNPGLPEEEREVMFNVGKYAMQNIYQIFQLEVRAQAQGLGQWLGATRVLPDTPVSGKDLLNLKLEPVRFTEAYIPGIGNVKIKHDPSLDNYPGADRFSKGFHQNGFAWTTYSMVIYDVKSQEFSNNAKLPEGATLIDGGDTGSNMYIVKPEGAMTYWGSEHGRYSSTSPTDILSSNKYQMESYWIYSMCAAWVKDLTRYVIIELDPRGRLSA